MNEKKPGKRGKRPVSAPAMRLRRVLGENVQCFLERNYPLSKYRKKSYQQQRFAADAGVSWSSIQRALDPEKGVMLDVIADLAAGMQVKGADLLTADFMLKLAQPPDTEPDPSFDPADKTKKKRRPNDLPTAPN